MVSSGGELECPHVSSAGRNGIPLTQRNPIRKNNLAPVRPLTKAERPPLRTLFTRDAPRTEVKL